MSKLSLAVLKAHRLKNTSTFGKQNIYLRLTAGTIVKTSDIHQDAGTDCALGEIFTMDLPPGVATVQVEVIAKHSLTGDESIGTASLSCELIQNSGGEVLRVPVMSKKGNMQGELECTGSVAEPASAADQTPSAPQLPQARGQNTNPVPMQQLQQAAPYPYSQQQQLGPYPSAYNQQQQQQQPYPASSYQPAPTAVNYPAATLPGSPYQQQQQTAGQYSQYPPQQQRYQPLAPSAYPPAAGYPPAAVGSAAAAYALYPPPTAVTPYPPPAGYPASQQVAAVPVQQQQQQAAAGMGRGSGMMSTALAAGAGALGGAVVGGALSSAMFNHHGGGWGGGWGYGGPGPGYYDGGGDTVIVNDYNTENVSVVENNNQVDDTIVDGGDWVDMDNGGDVGFVGGDDFGGGDW